MKKRLLAAAVGATVMLSVSVALAAPIDFDGEVEFQYRWDDHDGHSKQEGARTTFLLHAQMALTDQWDAYARFATQRYHGDDITADFNTRGGSRNSTTTFDRFGVIYKADHATYNFGRQGADLGANALLYSTSSNIGSGSTLLDGLTATSTIGATDLQLLAGQETDTDNRVYALHAAYQPASDWTVGATLARYRVDAGDNTNHWGVDTAYTRGATTYLAEYAKSNADNDNRALAFGILYDLDAKNSFGITYARVEAMGDMGGNTDFDTGYKGLYLNYGYKWRPNTTLNLGYSNLKEIDSGDKYNYVKTTINFAF